MLSTPRSDNCKQSQNNMLSKIINIFFLLALVAAAPVREETLGRAEATEDGAKYAEDKGAGRPVLSYVFGAAGCLVILGVIFFAYCKYKRGARVLGMQKKSNAANMQHTDVEMCHLPVAPSHGRNRTILSQYGTDNPYGWPSKPATPIAAVDERWLQDYTKPLPRLPGQTQTSEEPQVKKPAPVAQPPTNMGRKPVPGAPIRQIFPNSSGYYQTHHYR
ncbi:uncharacterized protein N0V89_005321 [Didymosphaeria variabile]|uniref:Uncharacterized protein n=1 Tax=Didymosphaeria variabile TaxID=1932322 RepID=A0A9W8XL46_9PLEO|nr:uncharacterized protein N0V89_005321 [Didymosphaeria variabile]KAJ4353591.1 hypothetical protein N0V89_005321 [Didymosphaeria variabile]